MSVENIRFKRAFVYLLVACIVAACFHYVPKMMNASQSIHNARFNEVWSQLIRKQILATPVFVKDRIVFGTNEGDVQAISAADGTSLWSLDFKDPVFALSKDANGIVYIGTGLHFHTKATLAAIDAVNGQILWQQEFDGHIEEGFTFDEANHRMWIGAGSGGLWAIDMRDGSTLWHQGLGHLDGTPLLAGGVIYVPVQQGEDVPESYFYALNADDGAILWRIEQPGQPWAVPVLDKSGQTILTSTGQGQIGVPRDTDKGWAQAISLSGEPVWQVDLPGMSMTPTIYRPDHDLLIHTTKNGNIIALNAINGTSIWQTNLAQEFTAEAVFVDLFKEPVIALNTKNGTFYIMDALNGTVLYTKEMKEKSNTAPLVHNGIVYISTAHHITAMRMK